MHILGKILTWLILFGALPAVVLTARLLDVQNSWTKQVKDLRVENEKNAVSLIDERTKLERLKTEVQHASMGSGPFWVGLEVAVANRTTGQLSANIGTSGGVTPQVAKDDQGNDAQFAPVLHAFQPLGDFRNDDTLWGYVGAFQVTGLRENQLTMMPTWKIQAGATDDWNGGPGWYFRRDVPLASKIAIDELRLDLESARRAQRANQLRLTQQQAQLVDATDKLNYRRSQLLGFPDPQTEAALEVEFRKGLVPAIEEVEEQRNAAFADVDRLRRQIKLANDLLFKLNGDNKQLIKSLPQPASAAVTKR